MPRSQFDFRAPRGLLAMLALPRVGQETALRAALHPRARDHLLKRNVNELVAAFEHADEQLARHAASDVEVIGFFDKRYPARLRQLSSPPPLLYVRGDVS